MPARTVSLDDVDAALKPVIRRGLPVTPETAGELLPDLRCVYALAVHPDDRLSRVAALDQLLRELLNQLGDSDFGQATRLLFALDATAVGTKLTVRRQRAAELLRYDPDHFRKRIEPKLRRTVASVLHELNRKYKPRSRQSPPEREVVGHGPSLGEEDISEHQELTSRIWSGVYGLRAELIAARRLAGDPARESDCQYHHETALWQLARLLTVLADYLDRYGERILHGEIAYNAESVIRLAGWRGELRQDQAQLLRYVLAKGRADDRAGFLRRLQAVRARARAGVGSSYPDPV